jgi:hypothetical protein
MARDILEEYQRAAYARLEDGAVLKIVGVVRVRERALNAPLSHRDCVYFEARARRDGRVLGRNKPKRPANNAKWHVLIRDREIVDFDLEVEGRLVQIDTSDALVEVERQDSASLRRTTIEEWLRANEVGDPLDEYLSVDEGVVVPGAMIAVAGSVRAFKSADAGSYRDPQVRYVMGATDKDPLALSDDPSTFE